MTDFQGDVAKKKEKNLKIKNGPVKKTEFFKTTNSQYFYQNFRDWSLGDYSTLMQGALLWHNLYGCQAVRRKLKKGLKMHF